MKQIKALSYNIHKGFSITNRNFVLEKIRKAIRDVDPDIIFLQEVIGHHEEDKHEIDDWPTKAQFEYLAHELCEHYAYGKNAVYDKGHHGNALLSKFPITFWENINISTNRLEKRGMLHAVVDINEKQTKLHCVCLHLDLLENGRKKQIKKVVDRIKSSVPDGEPVIMAGDFNDWQRKVTKTLEEELMIKEAYLTQHGKHAKTFPSASPFLTLDRIYFRGINLKEAIDLPTSPWKELSDHMALFAIFQIN
jgi:endonuclease/exonuclease/phosphatase family metal-dependent hydrolase